MAVILQKIRSVPLYKLENFLKYAIINPIIIQWSDNMAQNRKNTFTETAYQAILQKIIQEQITPGTPLREERLATELGISATPVREAFRRLEYEGWLQSSPYKGVYIRKYTPQDISELYLLREAMESTGAAEAACNATDEDIEKIRCILENQQRYLQERESLQQQTEKPVRIELELNFHATVAEAAHNTLLLQRINMLRAQTTYLWLNHNNPKVASEKNSRRALEEHWMIYLAIQRRWVDQARSLMAKHISFARENHMKILQNSPDSI